jgi:triosephosphate isomerase (TIM)
MASGQQGHTMTQPLAIVGNWKMNGSRAMLAEARAIDRGAARRSGVKVSIAPPFTLIQAMAEAAQGIAVGGRIAGPR